MSDKLNYVDIVTQLLNKKGVGERKHASTLASILGLQYNSAKQKLDGKRGITLHEVKNIFKYFQESFDGNKNHNCIFIMNSIHKRCNIEISDITIGPEEESATHAIKSDGMYIIDSTQIQKEGVEHFKVETIDFLPAPKIAILDNNNDILDLMEKIVKRYGIDSDTFNKKGDLLQSMESIKYEGYILDWLLDFNETPEKAIVKIREQNSICPIIILTGQVDHFEKSIGEMILKYDVQLIEKPAKPFIISSLLLSSLFFN
ncbi:helix-turn-helix domain-containing protein [Serratia sp. DD3]|uniref:helix-turn-helix domain-containing protein n=1 Tax=Serratia sp. DD3 TaxID=1410619 RepID=UPI0004D4D41F|nr:helix-turn-helix domain-containing protein [Serratia sp. DD3]KEY60688.1 BetR domain protein [Serratia sp. DD3]